ncbi:hypothetical protein WG899_05570 [Paucibacter sp. AS339]|uniref:YybH family protein n=1 Tax=Paucibacter hankyongi TaxID=3133434 RepID=UPI003096DD16
MFNFLPRSSRQWGHAALLALASAAFAGPARAESADEAALTEAVAQLYRSLGSGDVAGFAALVPAGGFSEFNTEAEGLQTLTMDYFRAVMTSGAKIALRVSDLQPRLLGGDTALVTGYRVGSITLPSGQRFDSRQALTMLWRKAPSQVGVSSASGAWQLLHVHLSEPGRPR